MSISREVIARVRTRFLAQVRDNPNNYHPSDVQRVATNDWWVERFVLVNSSEDHAIRHLLTTMEWRMRFGVNDNTYDSFPKELYQIGKHFESIY